MTPNQIITEFIEEVKRLDMSMTPGPLKQVLLNSRFGGFGINAVEPMRGRIDSAISGLKESDADGFCNYRTSAPRLAEALSWTIKYIGPDDPRNRDALRHIARILQGEGEG